jgi:cytochrome oxidase assembly protein ShyY1
MANFTAATVSQEGGASVSGPPETQVEGEHFKPIGTWFILGVFVATIVLLWMSVYVILLSRGVTVG